MRFSDKVWGVILGCFLISGVYAADKLMRPVDNALEQDYEDLKEVLAENYSDDIYNEFLRIEITKMQKRVSEDRYSQMGAHISNVYNSGDVAEINRIYNCVYR